MSHGEGCHNAAWCVETHQIKQDGVHCSATPVEQLRSSERNERFDLHSCFLLPSADQAGSVIYGKPTTSRLTRARRKTLSGSREG